MGAVVTQLRNREPSPAIWFAERVDDLGYGLYAAIILLEVLIIWLQYR